MSCFYATLVSLYEAEHERIYRHRLAENLLYAALVFCAWHGTCAYISFDTYKARAAMFIDELSYIMPLCCFTAMICDGMLVVILLFYSLGFTCADWPLHRLWSRKYFLLSVSVLTAAFSCLWVGMFLAEEEKFRKCGKGFTEFSCKRDDDENKMLPVNCAVEGKGPGWSPEEVLKNMNYPDRVRMFFCFFLYCCWRN